MTDTPPALGDMSFLDNSVPGIKAGNYWISVGHDLPRDVNPGNRLNAVQEFVVSAPQFVLDPAEIVSQHPAPTATGRFGEQLPHIVFREPTLPWERDMGTGAATPWLALLVLAEDELLGGVGSPTRAITSTIAEFVKPEAGVLKPALVVEHDVDTAGAVNSIRISPATFAAVMPLVAELPFLAHCRRADIADKAAMNLGRDGLSSVVVASRFPKAPAQGEPPVRNIVHLVSLEGFADRLKEQANFSGVDAVALVSLASWIFECQPDNDVDFRGLAAGLVGQGMAGKEYRPERLWLRLDMPVATDTGAGAEAARRLARGYVPLGYHTRAGDDGFAWYRGPLVPVRAADLPHDGPFLTADSAIIYQASHGVFDLSLAAAWEAGRAVALADKAFGQRMLEFRRRAHKLTDGLQDRLRSSHFPSQQRIESLATDATAQDEFASVLKPELVRQVAAAQAAPGPDAAAPRVPHPLTAPPGSHDAKAAIQAFLAEPAAQARLAELLSDDMDGIAAWLARLSLLYPVPFNLLVPDERMLPPESIRFFHLDRNWIKALMDGALSLGMESSRQSVFNEIVHDPLHERAIQAAKELRRELTGVEPPGEDKDDTPVSGFLLRSAMVAGWPNLAVRGYAGATGEDTLKILRMDHLSPSVLLCLFAGVPARVELAEPQEGFRFGVDDNGCVALRSLVAGAGLGDQVGDPFAVYDPTGKVRHRMRAAGSRVLDLNPAAAGGLVQSLAQELVRAKGLTGAATLKPSQFALQMVKSPEAVVFTCQP